MTDQRLSRFRTFNDRGGKLRVAVTDVCNLDCFFCHNEGMANPRRPGLLPLAAAAWRTPVPGPRLEADDLVDIMNAFARLRGRQINVTGGEPLAHPEIARILESVEKGGTLVILNTNAILAERLLARPPIATLDAIFASLHATDDAVFERSLGARPGTARRVMENLVALARHGYRVQINCSLGDHNRDGFDGVLDFAIRHAIDLKAIALVRPTEEPGFYGGAWIDPRFVSERLERRGATVVSHHEGLGGRTATYRVGRSTVQVKNIARGRLRTDFCAGCPHEPACGEGIYALRVGVDGLFKPCLLRREAFRPVRRDAPYEAQILDVVDAMIGDFERARFATGAPA